MSEQPKPQFRETIEVAVGPNPDGHDAMARDAHAAAVAATAPDPAIVDNPEAPELAVPTTTPVPMPATTPITSTEG